MSRPRAQDGHHPDGPGGAATPGGPPADYVPYRERRPYLVADSLDQLTGPTTGTVTLPVILDWSGNPTHDLDAPGGLKRMYAIVLSEALRPEYLATYLNREKLIDLWPDLLLPRRVRQMWEERFPELAATSRT